MMVVQHSSPFLKDSLEAFLDEDKVILKDVLHSKDEERFILLGKTSKGRLLYVVFTMRGENKEKVRIISARDINKKEVSLYEKKHKRSLRSKRDLKIPKFKNEDEEREFWAKLDLSEYFEPKDFVPASFPNLKPTTRAISIRIPEYLLDRVKEEANELNIPYQSLIKQYIKKGVFLSS
ncbi:MAG: CopG family antitoxin [Patescibacteria group bacterium]